jgi:hypothetical protein
MSLEKFYEKPETPDLDALLNKQQILELVYFERFCRDRALWAEAKKCFAEDSTVTISWYQGSGWGFVDASSKMANSAPHRLENSIVWLNDDRTRGSVVMMACIQMRKEIDGIQLDLSSYARLYFTTEKIDGKWLIKSFDSIYDRDSLVPVAPPEQVNTDPTVRPSYAYLALCLGGKDGYPFPVDLPGDDKPETTTALMDKVSAWIA